MKNLLLYGLVVLSFMGVITAQWYDRTQLQAEIERLKNQPPPAPEVIIKEVPTIWERVEYRDKPVREVVETIQTQEVTRQLAGWDTLAQLTEWLAADDTDTANFQTPSNRLGACALYSGRLRLNAEKAGRYISWQLISESDYEKLLRGENLNYTHLMNLVEIDGRYYLIEPQTDKVYDTNSKWREALWTK